MTPIQTKDLFREDRGGSWLTLTTETARPAFDDHNSPHTRFISMGFRTTQKLTRPITKVRF